MSHSKLKLQLEEMLWYQTSANSNSIDMTRLYSTGQTINTTFLLYHMVRAATLRTAAEQRFMSYTRKTCYDQLS